MDNKIIKKHSKKLSLFLIIGIFKTILSIGLIWIFIDILRIRALLGSTIAVVIVFSITYFVYVIYKVIKPKFIKYASTTIGFNIVTILLIWILVDFMKFSGALSSTIVSGTMFIMRYMFFNKIGLINHG